jgi:SPP1 gp7 family putative phage head morphogenesis protein
MATNKRTIEYWERRFEDILVNNEKLALDYEKQLAKIYTQVRLDTQKELEVFYSRYAKETGLSMAEVRKRLNPQQLKRFRIEQQRYLDKVEELIAKGANLESYQKTLQRLSARAYVSRLQEIQNNLNTLVTLSTSEQELMLQDVLKSSYLQGYSQTMFALQKGLGFGMSFTVPSNDDVVKVLKTPWNGGNYADSVWGNKQKLTQWLNTDLPRHFAAGSSIDTMSKDLSKKLGSSYKDAVRLVRTEVNYISNQSTMDSYTNSGVVDEYQILATLDNRTSEICRSMDGKVFKVKDSQVGVNTPPFHPRCRTTTIPYFQDEDYEGLERAARGSDGKTYYVPANITYEQWQNKYMK